MEETIYAGMWVTDDGHIRHELLANGRYDEARGTRDSAYRGRYEITGAHIEYGDATKSPARTSNTGTIPASRRMATSSTAIRSITQGWSCAADSAAC